MRVTYPWPRKMSPHARRNRIVLVTLATVVVLLLLYMARGALFPFIIGGLLAYLLAPAVRVTESVMPWRARWPGFARVTAILVVYLISLGGPGGIPGHSHPARHQGDAGVHRPDTRAVQRRTRDGRGMERGIHQEGPGERSGADTGGPRGCRLRSHKLGPLRNLADRKRRPAHRIHRHRVRGAPRVPLLPAQGQGRVERAASTLCSIRHCIGIPGTSWRSSTGPWERTCAASSSWG